MQALLGLERVLDHAVGGRKSFVGVAAPQVIVERDIGALAALQVFEIGKGACRPQHVVNQSVGLHRRDLVIHRRQFVIFGGDQLHGLLGDVRIASQHGRNRLADITHFVERQDRLVVKGGAVIGFRDQLADIFAGDDAVHAGQLPRRLRIDAADAPVRHGRAKHFAVQHAGQPQIMRIIGAPGHLGAHFKPRNIPSDLVHACTRCASSARAWRTARLT